MPAWWGSGEDQLLTFHCPKMADQAKKPSGIKMKKTIHEDKVDKTPAWYIRKKRAHGYDSKDERQTQLPVNKNLMNVVCIHESLENLPAKKCPRQMLFLESSFKSEGTPPSIPHTCPGEGPGWGRHGTFLPEPSSQHQARGWLPRQDPIRKGN